MRELSGSDRITIRAENGWYMHSAGVAAFDNELVCTYRRSDEHIASEVEIWCCRSTDGGRTWQDHKLISRTSFENDRACWIAPQLNRTRDGTLLLLCDRGVKLSKFDWPMLSQWQQPPRGMSNWLFVSRDRGRTWDGPHKTDDVGGEPSYIVELSNGDWMYTRTDSMPTAAKKVPAMPWGPNYYRSTAVLSSDKGKTWTRTVPLADDPLVGDCEVGVAEYAAGRLIAITRIGDAGSSLGQPSRLVFSNDFGRTWSKPVLSPIYAHRACVKPLQDGRLLVSYRNAWGTPSDCVFIFDASEKFAYQPNSLIWDESRCVLAKDALEIRSEAGRESAVEFTLYPVEDDDSAVDFEAELQVVKAALNACVITAGVRVRLTPDRVELADRPQDGFAIDARQWHRYQISTRGGHVTILVDGEKKLEATLDGIFTRLVRFGNRPGVIARPAAEGPQEDRRPLRGHQYEQNAGVSRWRRIEVRVHNRRDHSVHWTWSPASGYPDQFRRGRVIRLEKCGTFAVGDCGYSSWAQRPRGDVVVVDYNVGNPPTPHPALRAYRLAHKRIGIG
jgi:hypothetical protein